MAADVRDVYDDHGLGRLHHDPRRHGLTNGTAHPSESLHLDYWVNRGKIADDYPESDRTGAVRATAASGSTISVFDPDDMTLTIVNDDAVLPTPAKSSDRQT